MKEENPFVLKSTKVVYKNPWIQVREDSVIRPGGKDGIFGIIEMLGGVTVVAIDSENNIYLTVEYAYAIESYSLECVSGGLDGEESILDAARRELREEIGGVSNDWVDLGQVKPITSILKNTNHMYLAKNVSIDFAQNTDEGEVIRVVRMPFKEAYEKVVSGEITHAASVAGILKTHILLNQ